ncbi:MAG: hypothetical protein U0230_26535 [Polyangiales bacterium]
MPTRILSLCLLLGLASCAPPFSRKAGETCYRTTECVQGTVCVMGVCSSDPTGLSGTVPSLDAGPDAALDAAVDGSVDAGVDAAVDAAVDASQPDASQPDASQPDASQPDASQPDAAVDPDASMDASTTDV